MSKYFTPFLNSVLPLFLYRSPYIFMVSFLGSFQLCYTFVFEYQQTVAQYKQILFLSQSSPLFLTKISQRMSHIKKVYTVVRSHGYIKKSSFFNTGSSLHDIIFFFVIINLNFCFSRFVPIVFKLINDLPNVFHYIAFVKFCRIVFI